MKDPNDKYTEDMYVDFDATEERLDKQVKEWLWNNQTKTFEPYPVGTVAEWVGKDHDEF